MSEKALEGVKVLEVAEFSSGPFCGMLLANMGAEVTKIERPKTGDPARKVSPYSVQYTNTNKKGITLDLRNSKGQKIFRDMVKSVDILIASGGPSELKKNSLNYDELKEINPKLIMVAISPFGQTGPYADYKAYVLNVAHVNGHAGMLPRFSKVEERPPVKPPSNVPGYDGGAAAMVAVLAALYYQRATGIGQFIDISEMEMGMDLQRNESVMCANGNIAFTRHKPHYLYGQYGGATLCGDGTYIFVANSTPPQNAKYMKLMSELEGAPERLKDPRWQDMAYCRPNVNELWELCPKLLKNFSSKYLVELFQGEGLPTCYMSEIDEVVASPHFNARGYFVELESPEFGKVEKFPGPPFILSESPYKVETAAPSLGQHNEEIYKSMGLDVEALKKEGII